MVQYTHYAGLVKRSNTADCKSALYEFGGSNPSPCTKKDFSILESLFCLHTDFTLEKKREMR
jgi:hypothetical protein